MTAPRCGQQAALQPSDAVLPSIPVVETRPGFPLATLLPCKERAHALIDAASHRYPRAALVALDKVSRAWLARWDNKHLAEIDTLARELDRPRTIVQRV